MIADLLTKIFKRGKLRQEYIDFLCSQSESYMHNAFTSSEYDTIKNYQVYEFLGDSVINNFVPYYFFRKYPQLHCDEGVKVLNRLKANFVSCRSLASIANSLGFWPYIRCHNKNNITPQKKNDLLEDVFEAFFGFTVWLLDEEYSIGVGPGLVYDILEDIFDDIPVSLEYDDLYDAKTRLKELFDHYPTELGLFKRNKDRNTPANLYIHHEYNKVVFRHRAPGTSSKLQKNIPVEIGVAEGNGTHADREQEASRQALEYFKQKGIVYKNEIQIFCEKIR